MKFKLIVNNDYTIYINSTNYILYKAKMEQTLNTVMYGGPKIHKIVLNTEMVKIILKVPDVIGGFDLPERRYPLKTIFQRLEDSICQNL